MCLGKDGIKSNPRKTLVSEACEGGVGPGRLGLCADREAQTARRLAARGSQDPRGPCWVAPPWRQHVPSQPGPVPKSPCGSSLRVELVPCAASQRCQTRVIHCDPRGSIWLRTCPAEPGGSEVPIFAPLSSLPSLRPLLSFVSNNRKQNRRRSNEEVYLWLVFPLDIFIYCTR